MSKEFIQKQIDSIMQEIEILSKELENKSNELIQTIKLNKKVYKGISMRTYGLNDTISKLMLQNAKISALRDILYSL